MDFQSAEDLSACSTHHNLADENGKMKKYTIKTQKYTIIIICQVIR